MRLIDADKLVGIYKQMCVVPMQAIRESPTVIINIGNRGHWISYKQEKAFGLMNYIKCSECSKSRLAGSQHPKFCQECGAKMFEEEQHDIPSAE